MKNGKGSNKKFVPFQHEQLELKNALIDIAREQAEGDSFAGKLSATFIYISFSEYLCEHLTQTISYYIKKSSFEDFGGIIYMDPKEYDRQPTFGTRILILDNYWFPAKEEIMKLLRKVNASRNIIFHNFAKVGEGDLDLDRVTSHIKTINESSEELFTLVNTVYDGLKKILLPISAESENETNLTKPHNSNPKANPSN